MSKSLMDAMLLAIALEEAGPSRKQFGEIMHNNAFSEREKQEVLQQVELLGGYINLFEGNERNN